MKQDYQEEELLVIGIPTGVQEKTAAVYRSRLMRTVYELIKDINIHPSQFALWIGTQGAWKNGLPRGSKSANTSRDISDDEMSVTQRAERYRSIPPRWSFEHLVISPEVREEIILSIRAAQLEPLIYDTWGLRSIEPIPRSAINLFGPSGTGKTLAAHCIASALNKNILATSYSDAESKYHGDGPKNVKAIFHAAERDNAVLFIDEADSLLSRRLTNVSQGSEQAINSMRSELLIALENFKGVVIFATNLIENYDEAFKTRVRHIHFPMPDTNTRVLLWGKHLPPTLPLSEDVNPMELAEAEAEFCGRDIKNAVIYAATRVAMKYGATGQIRQSDLLVAIKNIVQTRKYLPATQSVTQSLSTEQKQQFSERFKSMITDSTVTTVAEDSNL